VRFVRWLGPLAALATASWAIGCGCGGGAGRREGAREIERPADDASSVTPANVDAAPQEAPSDAGPVATDADASLRTTAVDASAISEGDAGRAAEAPPGMKLVPGGTFTMGTDKGGEGDERPAHAVTVGSFFLDVTEVTQTAYETCVAAGKCKPASQALVNAHGGAFKGPNKPIVGVSWFDARDYCTWKGMRLPREAEFERAVRGDDGRRFPWGAETPTRDRTVFAAAAPEDVGSHPAGRGPYGHDDLAGNVWEWMEDLYDPYAYRRPSAARGEPGTCDEITAAQNELRTKGMQGFTGTNPIPTECERSIRGGAYNYPAEGLRSTNRVHHPGTYKLKMTGFRCAKDAR
jgi:formylglycine-generating enzyme required for sulfatase activity